MSRPAKGSFQAMLGVDKNEGVVRDTSRQLLAGFWLLSWPKQKSEVLLIAEDTYPERTATYSYRRAAMGSRRLARKAGT